jgi:hypothetical protein
MATLTQPSGGTHRRSVRDLFSDQRFLLAVGLFVFSVAALLIHLLKNREPEPLEANNVNATVPTARIDSVSTSKLDLMAQNHDSAPMVMPGADGPSSLTTAGMGMQPPGATATSPDLSGSLAGGRGEAPASIPGSLDRYMYRKPTVATDRLTVDVASDNDFKTLSDYYEPDEARTPSATRSASNRDDEDEATVSPAVQYKKARELNRLRTLLEEYKRDKEAKAAARQENELKPIKPLKSDVVSGLDGLDRSRNNFYGLFSQELRQGNDEHDEAINGTFRAVINQSQMVLSGGRVQLRLLEDMAIQSVIIPRGTLIYGIGNFGAERVAVQITSVQLRNRIYPIKLSVYGRVARDLRPQRAGRAGRAAGRVAGGGRSQHQHTNGQHHRSGRCCFGGSGRHSGRAEPVPAQSTTPKSQFERKLLRTAPIISNTVN